MVSDPLDHQGSPLKLSSDDFYFLSEEASSPAGDEDVLCLVHTTSVLYCAHLCMKCSLGISNFVEEIFRLFHSVVFLYFFALITEEGFLLAISLLAILWNSAIKWVIFPFLLCL